MLEVVLKRLEQPDETRMFGKEAPGSGRFTGSERMYVREIDADDLDGFPSVLGYSSPNHDGYVLPTVELIEGNDGVSFAPTKAVDAAHPESVVLRRGRVLLGETTLREDETSVSVFYNQKIRTFRTRVTCTGRYRVYYYLSDENLEKIAAMETDHMNDFSHAFDVSVKTVAEKINGLAKRQFNSRGNALNELIKELPPQLVPDDPLDLPSWTPHLKKILEALLDFSKGRDRSGQHSPSGYKLTCDSNSGEAEISPILKSDQSKTQDLISLERIGSL